MNGNASIYRQHMSMKEGWMLVNNERQQVELSRGPLVNLERRNLVAAPINTRG